MKFTFLIGWILALGSKQYSSAVKYGDEEFGDIEGGRFWAFHTDGVSIVNPENCKVEHTFNKDGDGEMLPGNWYDGIYMEKEEKGYVLINSGVTTDTGKGEVLAISTDVADKDSPVISRIEVGPRPVHSYGVHTRDEFWTHSDSDGHFYIVSLNDVTKHIGTQVKAHVADAFHGKLLWDEDESLGSVGYATTTGENHILIMDMATKEQIASFDYKDIPDVEIQACKGTHAIAYSSVNKHLYAECSGAGGTLEIDASDPVNLSFVKQWTDVSGSLYEVPDGEFITVTSKKDNKLYVFKPGESGDGSTKAYEVDVPGHPSTPSFYPIGGDSTSATDFIACMPLTENTNKNHFDSAGNVACDFYGCDGAEVVSDVENGICAYDPNDAKVLLKATPDDIAAINAMNDPFNQACDLCKDLANFENDECICTPKCGSCADEDYDASNTGVVCVDLKEVVNNGKTSGTLIKGAGAVFPGRPYASSPECGFGRTYRGQKRGGVYIASVTNIPNHSLQIVNMKTQEYSCEARLDGAPNRVIYVPNSYADTDTSDSAIIRTQVSVLAAVSLMITLLL